jgi:hypothetical protein
MARSRLRSYIVAHRPLLAEKKVQPHAAKNFLKALRGMVAVVYPRWEFG